ncbi:unnamed protein product [Rhizophagus irregularis]|nr:unnamed protein product [Rhizophagus irregularis]
MIGCTWHTNLAFPKKEKGVRINSVIGEHNHSMNPLVGEIAPKFRKLTEEMLEKIKFWTIHGKMGIPSQYNLLVASFSNKTINKKNLSNAIQKFKLQMTPSRNDACQVLNNLYLEKEKNPLWNLIVGAAIIEDETEATFSWILQELRDACSITLIVLYSDADPTLISAFEIKWNELLNKYPICQPYLTHVLYSCKTSWACYAINQNFIAGVQSSQCAEVSNKIIKEKLCRASHLSDVVKEVQAAFDNQSKRATITEFKIEIPIKGLPTILNEYFPNLNELLQDFLIPQILQKQRDQISQLLCYDVTLVTDWLLLLEVKTINF